MNENQNPNVINNGTNVPQNGAVSAQPIQSAQPITTGTPVVQAQSPVAPTAPTEPVAATPDSQTEAQTSAPTEESPFFTPVSIQPEVQSSPVLPEVAPASPVAPNTPVAPVAQPTEVAQTPQPEDASNNGVEVIETAAKSRASNAILIIFLILLIIFVFNIDTVISMYDQYKNTKSITIPTNKNTNNVTDGFILIDENTSSVILKDIKFYNFRKTQGKGVTFSYEALANYDNAASLEIYIEIYNSDKEIIYKELFNPEQKVEKDTVRTYVMDVDNNIFDSAFYSLVKIYTEEDKKKTSTLTCTLDDEYYSYKHIYNFVNNGLSTYEVSKTSKSAKDDSLENELNELKDISDAKIDNNTLTYTIDLSKDNGDYVELYSKETTLKVVKEKETLKEWKCE